MHRQGCSRGRVQVGDHEEVEESAVCGSDDLTVNDSAFSWVDDLTICLLKEPGAHSLVDKDKEKSRVVALLVGLNCLSKLTIRSLELQAVLFHGRSSHAISVYDDLLWDLTIVPFLEVFEGLHNELLEDVSSVLAKPSLLD